MFTETPLCCFHTFWTNFTEGANSRVRDWGCRETETETDRQIDRDRQADRQRQTDR